MAQSSMTYSKEAPRPSQRMRVAYILTLIGGYLDAYTYFERGGVFANAQTGNIVKLGIALANGARDQYLRYLVPILVFTVGLLVSLVIKEVFERKNISMTRRVVLLLEVVGLGIVGLIPLRAELDIVANSIVSFVAALQYETFTTFRGELITTTMSTGNLKKCIDALFAGIVHKDMAKLYQAGVFASIILVFTTGAFVGTRACDILGAAAVVPAMLGLLLVAGIITFLRQADQQRS